MIKGCPPGTCASGIGDSVLKPYFLRSCEICGSGIGTEVSDSIVEPYFGIMCDLWYKNHTWWLEECPHVTSASMPVIIVIL
jgi:hypothetical protein